MASRRSRKFCNDLVCSHCIGSERSAKLFRYVVVLFLRSMSDYLIKFVGIFVNINYEQKIMSFKRGAINCLFHAGQI